MRCEPVDGRLKVLLAITRMVPGGAQREVLQLLSRLDRTRFHVSLVCNPGGEWVGQAAALAEAFHPLPDLVRPISPLRDVCATATLTRLIRRERYDIVHAHTAKAGIVARVAAQLAGVPVVLHTPHGTVFHECFLSPRMQQTIVFLERVVARRTSCILTKSVHETAEYVNRHIAPPGKFFTLYSGLDFSELARARNSPEAVRRALGIGLDQPMVLYAARFVPEKSHESFLAAFRRVLAEMPRAVGVLAGDGPRRREIEALAADLTAQGGLLSLGFRDDVADLMRAADVCVSASLTEGLPLAIVEALALGRPVAATDAGGTREIVKHQGTGLLVPPGDSAALAEAVLRLLRNPSLARQLGEQGQLVAHSLFGVEAMIAKTAALYEACWQQRHAAGCVAV